MPSSRHSSRSTRSPKPPTWRTVTISKNSAASTTSLSYVFAEPEQGSPLAPATSKLPSSRSLNNIDSEDRLPRRLVSMSSVRRDMDAVKPVERIEQDTVGVSQGARILESAQGCSSKPNVPPADAPHAPDAQLDSPPIINIIDSETPTNTANASVLSSSPVKSSSWFGSLTRAKGKAKAAQMNARAASSPAPSPAADDQPNGLSTALSVPSDISQAALEPPPVAVATDLIPTTAPPEPATAPVTPTPTPPTLHSSLHKRNARGSPPHLPAHRFSILSPPTPTPSPPPSTTKSWAFPQSRPHHPRRHPRQRVPGIETADPAASLRPTPQIPRTSAFPLLPLPLPLLRRLDVDRRMCLLHRGQHQLLHLPCPSQHYFYHRDLHSSSRTFTTAPIRTTSRMLICTRRLAVQGR
ncbi:hypothetical protein D9615_009939 [Tricholomella constricta]|uniref:Uncharacterized protein n=1 Tax=Tricholomella constricta TaxID=117010 RepID=A0A8H5LYF2_9AGAR|nr:hypothetical protein D9615_009939 [Tricholomella constricta]